LLVLKNPVDLSPGGLPLGCIIPGGRNQPGELLLSDNLFAMSSKL
jgi:hypothetical protein